MHRLVIVVALSALGALAVPTAAAAAPSSFAEIAGTLGKDCDRRLIREVRGWGITPTQKTGSVDEWKGRNGAKLVCKGRDQEVVRIEFARDWPLPRGMRWDKGWGHARKRIEKGGGTIVRRWKDDRGKHIHATLDGVKIGLHWEPKMSRVAIEEVR